AHRVLRPEGILLDLRPAAEHRRLGLQRGGRWRLVGAMRETFGEDHAADRAVARAIADGLFRLQARRAIPLARWMDTLGDFRTWPEESNLRRPLESHAFLIRRLERLLAERPCAIVSRGPVHLRVLRKLADASA